MLPLFKQSKQRPSIISRLLRTQDEEFTTTNLVTKINESPQIYYKALFIGMLKEVDPQQQYFNILYEVGYTEPAIVYASRCVANLSDSCILTLHDPRITNTRVGPYENSDIIKSYINLIVMYLLKLDNPQIDFNNASLTAPFMAAKIKHAVSFDPRTNRATIPIPTTGLLHILNSDITKQLVQKYHNKLKLKLDG